MALVRRSGFGPFLKNPPWFLLPFAFAGDGSEFGESIRSFTNSDNSKYKQRLSYPCRAGPLRLPSICSTGGVLSAVYVEFSHEENSTKVSRPMVHRGPEGRGFHFRPSRHTRGNRILIAWVERFHGAHCFAVALCAAVSSFRMALGEGGRGRRGKWTVCDCSSSVTAPSPRSCGYPSDSPWIRESTSI